MKIMKRQNNRLQIKIGLIAVLSAFTLLCFCAGTANADTYVSGQISVDTTWNSAGSPYIVTGDISVYNATSTPTLTIEPGVTVKFNEHIQMFIGTLGGYAGRLIADGTTDEIVFTGATQTKGYWGRLTFYQNSDGSRLNNVKVEYGGYYGSYGNVYLDRASVNVTNSTIAHSSHSGIYSTGASGDSVNILNNEILDNSNNGVYITGSYASLRVEDNNFEDNGDYPLSLPATYVDSLRDNTFTSNTPNEIELRGGTVSTDSTMRNQGVAYRVTDDISVYNATSTSTLTIEPGVTVKFNAQKSMYIGSLGGKAGRLIADGTTDEIVFTGATQTKGYWGRLTFYQNSDGSRLNNVKVEYGGHGNAGSVRLYSASSVNVTNSTIAHSSNYGIYMSHASNCKITGNDVGSNEYGMYLSNADDNDLSCNWVHANNQYGYYLRGGSTGNNISHNNIIMNGNCSGVGCEWDIYNAQNYEVNATNSYWGTSDPDVINASIYDHYDHSGYGIVNFSGYRDSPEPCAPIPEAATIILFSVGLVVLAGYAWWKRREKG